MSDTAGSRVRERSWVVKRDHEHHDPPKITEVLFTETITNPDGTVEQRTESIPPELYEE